MYPSKTNVDKLFIVTYIQFLVFAVTCSADIGRDDVCSNDNIAKDNFSGESTTLKEGLYRAAVLEHQIVDSPSIVESVDANLAIYKRVAKEAANNGVNVLVFPEDGLFLGKKIIEPVLTTIPDPKLLQSNESNPCLDPILFESSYILRNLSCIAKENNLYLIANFGTKQACEPEKQIGNQICPEKGYLALNTDVVIDPQGNFIERYRKYNMFLEVFDKATSLETIYFDTPYGRFGVFTCFDMIFKRPAVELVEKFHINTAIFPTLWYDELPILSAIQFQDGWSWTNKVNLLASNIHRTETGTTGSGIYSGYNSVYTSSNAQKSKLIIADIPITGVTTKCDRTSFNQKIIDIDTDKEDEDYHHLHYGLASDDFIYVLEKREEKQTICKGDVCCTIEYKLAKSSYDTEFSSKLIVIVRDGLREGVFNWYEQVCFLATLNSSFNPDNLPKTKYSMEGLVSFEKLTLTGTFSTKYVYPVAAYNVTRLLPRNRKEFNCDNQENLRERFTCKLELLDSSSDKPIYSFGMYGRVYDSDKMPEWWLNGGPRESPKPINKSESKLEDSRIWFCIFTAFLMFMTIVVDIYVLGVRL